jgi:hypothetical protein
MLGFLFDIFSWGGNLYKRMCHYLMFNLYWNAYIMQLRNIGDVRIGQQPSLKAAQTYSKCVDMW